MNPEGHRPRSGRTKQTTPTVMAGPRDRGCTCGSVQSVTAHTARLNPRATMRCPGSSLRQRGFSLLETLVAFSILAVCLGSLLRIFGGGGRAALLTDEYARAMTVAESLLASLGSETELTLGRRQGVVAGSIRWEVQVTPLPIQSQQLSDINFAFTPVWVEVSASWGEDQPRAVKLSTIRLLPTKGSDSQLNTPFRPGARNG